MLDIGHIKPRFTSSRRRINFILAILSTTSSLGAAKALQTTPGVAWAPHIPFFPAWPARYP
mgnify:CR=1 FL=1